MGKKKGGKGDTTVVFLESTVSGHQILGRRHRLGEKLETMAFDPAVQQMVLFKEAKKIKTLGKEHEGEWFYKPTQATYPSHFNVEQTETK